MRLADHLHMPVMTAVMTTFPYSVSPDDPVDAVERLMEEHAIRHIPVQVDGKVVGLISERDLHHRGHGPLPLRDRRRASAVMLRDPFVVEINTSLAEVLEEMARRHIGCAIVLRHGKLAGIFSSTDACRVLAAVLRDRFPEGGPGDAA